MTARYNDYTKVGTLARTDTTQKKLFTLPPGSIPLFVSVFTDAAAVGGTIDVGTAADADLFVDGLDVSAIGMTPATLLSIDQLTVPTDVYALIAGAAAGGPFTVFFGYINLKSRRVI